MELNKTSLQSLHFYHSVWNKELAFYKDEISVLEPHLQELTNKYTLREVIEEIEHFQNQFDLHKENINILQNDINSHEKRLANYAQNNPIDAEHDSFGSHRMMTKKMETQRSIYHNLKKEYYLFMEKWM